MKMKKNLIFLYLIFVSFTIYSQDIIQKCNDVKEYENGKYSGCLNFEASPDGFGKMSYKDGDIYEGNWSRGYRSGFGKLSYSNGGSYEGDWVKNKKEGIGARLDLNKGYYKGGWKNNMYNGDGEAKIIFDTQYQIIKGLFRNGELQKGIKEIFFENGDKSTRIYDFGEVLRTKYISASFSKSTIGSHFSNGKLNNGKQIYIENNIITESNFQNGESLNKKRNIDNYYITEDILGQDKYITIELEKELNDDTMYVYLKFSTNKPVKPVRFVFDTGAEMFSIGYKLFENLKMNGLSYEDLNVTVNTYGIRGEPTPNKVIKIKELTIGNYTVKNVIAFVETLETANTSLLGIQFLKKFKEVQWSLNSNKLVFYK
tara:strand:+ start:288 stop:1400 length:1113 start_codon:yes stop_codon:yes gene_type:complete